MGCALLRVVNILVCSIDDVKSDFLVNPSTPPSLVSVIARSIDRPKVVGVRRGRYIVHCVNIAAIECKLGVDIRPATASEGSC